MGNSSAIIVLLLSCALDARPLAGQYVEFLQQPILGEDERRSMMYSYVDRNLPSIELPTDITGWQATRSRLLGEIRRLVGLDAVDHRGTVKWVSKGRIDRETYTIEKILYEIHPGMLVPGLVYTPKGLAAPAPAMVSIPGHEYCDGKAGPTVQARAVNLVRRGIIVLSYDYIDTFERSTGNDPCAGMPYGGGNDHSSRTFSYTAGNPTGLEILDGIRAIDYLYTRTDVDRNRIGFTGESGGSNSTYWVSALDERVRLAVPVSSVTTFDYWIHNNRNWDWHQRPPGIRRIAEIGTLLALIAPRPLLVIASLRGTDSQEFPFEETQKSVRQAKRIYDLYDAGRNIELWESKTSHGYQTDKRERMYGWVEHHFLGKNTDASSELAFLFDPREGLRCGLPRTVKTLADVYRGWLEQPATALPQIRNKLRDLLGLGMPYFQPTLGIQRTTSRLDAVINQLIIESEPGIHIPAVEYRPRNSGDSRTVLILDRTVGVESAIEPFLSRGLRAVFVDPRGVGEIDSGGGRTDNWAWLMGRPWPGMWVEDIQAAVTALSADGLKSAYGVIGSGPLGKAALFSAALNPRIGAVLARLPSLSYRDEAAQGHLADIPRILSALDLPEVAALVAPRACWLEFTRSPSVTEERIRYMYQPTADSYLRTSKKRRSFRAEVAGAADWNAVADWFSAALSEPQRPSE